MSATPLHATERIHPFSPPLLYRGLNHSYFRLRTKFPLVVLLFNYPVISNALRVHAMHTRTRQKSDNNNNHMGPVQRPGAPAHAKHCMENRQPPYINSAKFML